MLVPFVGSHGMSQLKEEVCGNGLVLRLETEEQPLLEHNLFAAESDADFFAFLGSKEMRGDVSAVQ